MARPTLTALLSALVVAGAAAVGAGGAQAAIATCDGAVPAPSDPPVSATAAWDPAFPDEIVAQICVARGTVTNAALDLEVDRGRLEMVALDPLGASGGIYLGSASREVRLARGSASPVGGLTSGLGMRLRVVTDDYFAEVDPRITARLTFLATYDDGVSPTQILRVPESAVASAGLLRRPACALTDRSAAPSVSPLALTIRQLVATGVWVSLRLCPGETLKGSLYPPGTTLGADGAPTAPAAAPFGATASAGLSGTSPRTRSVGVRPDARSGGLGRMAGLDRLTLGVVAAPYDPPGVTLPASALVPAVVAQRVVRVLGPPVPLPRPALTARRHPRGAELTVSTRVDASLAGRRAVIERVIGTRHIRLGVARVRDRGLIAGRFVLRRDRADGARAIAGVNVVRVRVRLAAAGRAPAAGGSVATIRLPAAR
ncbi:MAG: hypothetical protein JHC74_00775 [Thermoleophilia bacterium]|nr:hypothetical protein [Thermoleophilia bacterium]